MYYLLGGTGWATRYCPWGTGGAGGKGACGAHRLRHGGARGAWGGGLALLLRVTTSSDRVIENAPRSDSKRCARGLRSTDKAGTRSEAPSNADLLAGTKGTRSRRIVRREPIQNGSE